MERLKRFTLRLAPELLAKLLAAAQREERLNPGHRVSCNSLIVRYVVEGLSRATASNERTKRSRHVS